jgi:chloramphenicol-sensitive protein RarD
MGLATGAYVIWGLTPVYWKAIAEIPATEVLIPRIVWTALLLLAVAWLTGRHEETWSVGARGWGPTAIAALLLAVNWGVFIFAVQSGQVLATSLGYYINPLVSILLGMLILGERLSPAQAIAVLVAGLGVATMTIRAGELPWVSLALAVSFALYGLIHKLSPQPPIAGLTREMLMLSPLALAGLLLLDRSEESALLEASLGTQAFLSLTSIVTASPLLLFHAATRRLPLIAVGMFQYIAPTLTLLLAVLLYDEAFTRAHALGFGCVWTGLGLFSFDAFRRAHAMRGIASPTRNSRPATPPAQGKSG